MTEAPRSSTISLQPTEGGEYAEENHLGDRQFSDAADGSRHHDGTHGSDDTGEQGASSLLVVMLKWCGCRIDKDHDGRMFMTPCDRPLHRQNLQITFAEKFSK